MFDLRKQLAPLRAVGRATTPCRCRVGSRSQTVRWARSSPLVVLSLLGHPYATAHPAQPHPTADVCEPTSGGAHRCDVDRLGFGRVRFHDLRHTFATLALSAGEHYMQVSKWLGHSSYVLTLTTYADHIREDDTAAAKFERPVANAKGGSVTALRKVR